MACQVKVIEDSVSLSGVRLTTMQLRYWRAIHGEFMTHRMFSRNASSSRATPVEKMIQQVENDPAGPIHWGANQKGMQAREQVGEREITHCQAQWARAAEEMCNRVRNLMQIGLHKQVANRLLEPFQYISVVVTATDWDNFFNLRCHPDAQPEMEELASAMRAAMDGSQPVLRGAPGGGAHNEIDLWHLPYITPGERSLFQNAGLQAAQISTARCARVSYNNHDGSNPDLNKDLELYEMLVGASPMHASPTEHQARAWYKPESYSGNLRGWRQHRKMIEDRQRAKSLIDIRV